MEEISETKEPKIKIREWFSKHRKIVLIVLGILVASLIGGGVFAYVQFKNTPAKKASTTTNTVKVEVKKPDPIKYYSELTGNEVVNEATTKLPVTGIMIENTPMARPQSGLKDSGVIFEAIAEGGITRFLVIYQQEKPQLIGPVRSIRLYDLDWLAAFDASVGHIGGSAAALAEVRNGSYRDIDQFFNAGSYWRSSDRYAPHNVYTSFEKIDALNTQKGYTASSFNGFKRIDGQPVQTPDATSIDVTISSDTYNSSYIYNKTTNTYDRYQAGQPHIDRESGQISPSVVVVLKVAEETVLEDGYRQSITTIGSGSATIFQNGTVINATWNKKSKTDQITFNDASGKSIALVRGQTWLVAVPNNTGDVTWK